MGAAMGAAERIEELLPLGRVLGQTGLGKTSLYNAIREEGFPRPIKVGAKSLWVLSEVQAWIVDQVRAQRPERNGHQTGTGKLTEFGRAAGAPIKH